MTGAAKRHFQQRRKSDLVLQGGGALGAYEWGAIDALCLT